MGAPTLFPATLSASGDFRITEGPWGARAYNPLPTLPNVDFPPNTVVTNGATGMLVKVNGAGTAWIPVGGGSSGVITWTQSQSWASIQSQLVPGTYVFLIDNLSGNPWVIDSPANLGGVVLIGMAGSNNPANVQWTGAGALTNNMLQLVNVNLTPGSGATNPFFSGSGPFYLSLDNSSIAAGSGMMGGILAINLTAGAATIIARNNSQLLGAPGAAAVQLANGQGATVFQTTQSNINPVNGPFSVASMGTATVALTTDATCPPLANTSINGVTYNITQSSTAAAVAYPPQRPQDWASIGFPVAPALVQTALDALVGYLAGAIPPIEFSLVNMANAGLPAILTSGGGFPGPNDKTTGQMFVFTKPSTITGVRFWWPGGPAQAIKCSVWDPAGVQHLTFNVGVNIAPGIKTGVFQGGSISVTGANLLKPYIATMFAPLLPSYVHIDPTLLWTPQTGATGFQAPFISGPSIMTIYQQISASDDAKPTSPVVPPSELYPVELQFTTP